MTGAISTAGLLDEKIRLANGKVVGRKTSPERVQALVVTLGVAGYLLSLVLAEASRTLPEVPETMLLLLFGSQLTYLGVKGRTVLRVPPAASPSPREYRNE